MFFLSALSRSNKFEPAYNVCQRLLIAAITTADNQKKKKKKKTENPPMERNYKKFVVENK